MVPAQIAGEVPDGCGQIAGGVPEGSPRFQKVQVQVPDEVLEGSGADTW